jgi:hypothetical protein
MPVKAGYLLLTAGGGLLLWSAIQGKSITGAARAIIGGDSPSTATSANQLSGNSGMSSPAVTGADTGGNQSNQALAQQIASALGYQSWTTGQEWQDWVSLWNRESGWSATAKNPGSGAYGIAQSLGHPSSDSSEYGGYGLNASESAEASNGNVTYQIIWGIGYIASEYGSPSAAWEHEEQNGWY